MMIWILPDQVGSSLQCSSIQEPTRPGTQQWNIVGCGRIIVPRFELLKYRELWLDCCSRTWTLKGFYRQSLSDIRWFKNALICSADLSSSTSLFQEPSGQGDPEKQWARPTWWPDALGALEAHQVTTSEQWSSKSTWWPTKHFVFYQTRRKKATWGGSSAWRGGGDQCGTIDILLKSL